VKVIGQDLKDSSEDTVFASLLKAPVYGGRGSVTLQQISPLGSGAQDPEHSIERGAGIGPRAAGAALQFLPGINSTR
jgi:hypothetical protein